MEKSKSSIAILLSRLEVFIDPDVKGEQYPTDSEIAAEMLWNAAMIDGLEGKQVIDLGCGTGILGIGASLLGAAEVVFVDRSPEALKVLRTNLSGLEGSWLIAGRIDYSVGIGYQVSGVRYNSILPAGSKK